MMNAADENSEGVWCTEQPFAMLTTAAGHSLQATLALNTCMKKIVTNNNEREGGLT